MDWARAFRSHACGRCWITRWCWVCGDSSRWALVRAGGLGGHVPAARFAQVRRPHAADPVSGLRSHLRTAAEHHLRELHPCGNAPAFRRARSIRIVALRSSESAEQRQLSAADGTGHLHPKDSRCQRGAVRSIKSRTVSRPRSPKHARNALHLTECDSDTRFSPASVAEIVPESAARPVEYRLHRAA